MMIDSINLNHFRIFESVYRTKSMTTAAKELHLTQSGVSQHIKSLEEVLGVVLFDRVKQRLVPTRSAAMLYKQCSQALRGLEEIVSEMKGGHRQLSGSVSIGIPVEFGNNVILPLVSEFCKENPRVNFVFRYGFATEMNDGILDGTLDFAFVDAFHLDRRIKTEKVYDEALYLCATPELIKRCKPTKENREYFESLEYVDYKVGEPVLRMWLEHHLGTKKFDLNVRANVMDVQGVAQVILTGLAAGVLPGHLIQRLENEDKKLHKFKGSGDVLLNAISVAIIPDKTHSAAAAAAFKWLMASLMKRGSKKVLLTGDKKFAPAQPSLMI